MIILHLFFLPSLFGKNAPRRDSFSHILYIVTALVVVLSIASLILIAVGSFREHRKGLGVLSLAALACMFFGAGGSMNLPKEIFGVAERFSTYSAVVFTGVPGVYRRWETAR